jgi:hypothetical protein
LTKHHVFKETKFEVPGMLVVANEGKTMSELESDGTHVDVESFLNVVRVRRHRWILNIYPLF